MGQSKSDKLPTSVEDLKTFASANFSESPSTEQRMAGDSLGISFAEENAKQKYSSDVFSKSPSGYLSQSSKLT